MFFEKISNYKKDIKIAIPPKVGIFPLWILRPPGRSKKPFNKATFRIIGVNKQEMPAAIKKVYR